MTQEIAIVLAILLVAIILLVSEWMRYDGVAVLVLVALAVTGSLPVERAIEGFSSPAVVTIAAVLVLSGGLYKTGIANIVGEAVLHFAGDSPVRVTVLLMLTAGLLSGVMNNIAATALLLPVALDIARRVNVRPSRILIPLSFGSLVGGMTTLIGTGPNILLATALEAAGEGTFGLFSFTPVGSAALAVGVIYMVLLGRHLLPDRSVEKDGTGDEIIFGGRYNLGQTLFSLRIPQRSALDGKTLVQSRLGRALGFNLLAVKRGGRLFRAPKPGFEVQGGDVLMLEGRKSALRRLRSWGRLEAEVLGETALQSKIGKETALARCRVDVESVCEGQTIRNLGARTRFGGHCLALRREGQEYGGDVGDMPLQVGDELLLLGDASTMRRTLPDNGLEDVTWPRLGEVAKPFALHRLLLRIPIPEGSGLDGVTLAASGIRKAFGVSAMLIQRENEEVVLPGPDAVLAEGDVLIVEGEAEDLEVLRALQELIEEDVAPTVEELESDDVGFAEATLSPSSNLVGKTLREILFREAYGLSLVAMWRGGKAFYENRRVQRQALRFGDTLLVYGPRHRVGVLARDPRFLVLTAEMREVFRVEKAPLAVGIMLGVVLTASFNLVPIYIAALAGALLMVCVRCVRGNEVYGMVQWQVVVLIGGMIALGIAMEESGAAELIARGVVGATSGGGPQLLIAGLFLLCGLACQFMPTAAVAVLVAPIALSTAGELGYSAQALLMVVAVGSSCAFLSPFGHAVNLLVMGAGGYKVSDYTRVGAPLFVLLLLLAVFFLPVIWPLQAS